MASHRKRSFGLAAVFVSLPLAAWALSGCGSGNGTSPVPGIGGLSASGGTGSSAAAAFANRSFDSVVALSEGQMGTLHVTTTASGTASGTFTIADNSRAAAKSRFVIATPFLSGSFDPETGAFSLSGSYTDATGHVVPLSISGTFPTPPSYTGGSITTTINGKSYTSTFGGGTTASPSPSPSASGSPTPSPSASPTPTPTPMPSGTPAPGGAVNTLTITQESGTNPNNSFGSFVADPTSTMAVVASGAHNAPTSGGAQLQIAAVTDLADTGPQSAGLTIAIITPAGLPTGTYPVAFKPNKAPSVLFTYSEFAGSRNSWQSYNAQVANDGVFTIEQVDANKVRVRFSNVRLDPAFGGNGKGTLRISGVLETTQPPSFIN